VTARKSTRGPARRVLTRRCGAGLGSSGSTAAAIPSCRRPNVLP